LFLANVKSHFAFARTIEGRLSVFLDLESASDRARVSDANGTSRIIGLVQRAAELGNA
jgi:hypothetical protein